MSEELTTPKPTLSVAEKKAAILELAKTSLKRPNQKTCLGNALSNYVNPRNGSYDMEFHATLKELAPTWFRAVKTPAEALPVI